VLSLIGDVNGYVTLSMKNLYFWFRGGKCHMHLTSVTIQYVPINLGLYFTIS